MNYLAHIYLSGDDDNLLKIGNFVADSIKGKAYKKYPKEIQNGIILHREIDTFTDTHPIVFESKHRLFKRYRHYSAVIVDILYDHFLAKNWENYHEKRLSSYVDDFYLMLKYNFELLPKRVQNFYPYMVSDNWLLSYAKVDGIEKILSQMSMRIKRKIQLQDAVEELNKFYSEFEQEFTAFFIELKAFTEDKRNELRG
ncbi:ACP phosphodiesterase [Mesonia aestuariivivens]|uniref:DUF479 domain-containing protein n=1 Tax=Mesonia aestuariivivens TaxID=2796128 RepID=A0ABS6W0Q3_9FLAO|nr:ACP phosphodiesterase [Mesonia aestuariivivens]MBW2961410.1 DUF479 domain-containing protein [Mesonia aestuariivivens]